MPLTALPTDALALILANLILVRGVARVCRAFRAAADAAELLQAPKAQRRVAHEGHTERISSVAVTPGGHVVTASRDMTIKVWLEGVCIHTMRVPTSPRDGPVAAMALMPGSARLAIALDGEWGCAEVYSLVDGKLRWESDDAPGQCLHTTAKPYRGRLMFKTMLASIVVSSIGILLQCGRFGPASMC